jgi:hypothetical protein
MPDPTSEALIHLLPLLEGFAPVTAGGSYTLMEAVNQTAHEQLRVFIDEQFRTHFKAAVPDDTRRLLGVFGPDGELTAAFGIRTREDGFFSEHYLSMPLDIALLQKTGERFDPERVVEISHFSIASPKGFKPMVQLIADGLSRLHFDHVICTATRCLVRYFARRYLTPTILTEARVTDLPEPQRQCWGSYYLKDPAVAFGHLSGVLREAV